MWLIGQSFEKLSIMGLRDKNVMLHMWTLGLKRTKLPLVKCPMQYSAEKQALVDENKTVLS